MKLIVFFLFLLRFATGTNDPDPSGPSGTCPGCNMTAPETAVIKGRLFIDSNRDFSELTITQDPSELEAPIAGQPVRLLDTVGGILEVTSTDSNGNYIFQNLTFGYYRVQVPKTIFDLSLITPNQVDDQIDSDFFRSSGVSQVLFLGVGALIKNLDAGYDCFSNPTDPENLLCNGSFEYNTVATGTTETIQVRNLPGWRSPNGQFAPIKLYDDVNGISAVPPGSIYVELDTESGGNVEGIFQDIPTENGQKYILSWFMRARDPSKASTEDEGLVVSRFGKTKTEQTSIHNLLNLITGALGRKQNPRRILESSIRAMGKERSGSHWHRRYC